MWTPAMPAKHACKKKLRICEEGVCLGSQFFAYSELSNLILEKTRVSFEHNGDSYRWARPNPISGGIDAVLTVLLGVAVSDAMKENKAEFLKSIDVANKYVLREKLVPFLLLGYVLLVGLGFGFGHRWFISDPSRFWLLAIGMVVGPIHLRLFANRRYSMANNYLNKRPNQRVHSIAGSAAQSDA